MLRPWHASHSLDEAGAKRFPASDRNAGDEMRAMVPRSIGRIPSNRYETKQRFVLGKLDSGTARPISFHYDESPQNSFPAPIGQPYRGLFPPGLSGVSEFTGRPIRGRSIFSLFHNF